MIKTASVILLCVLAVSCQPAGNDAPRNARIKAEAAMHQKVDEVIEQLYEDCDSSLLALARYRADSIKAARGKRKLPGRSGKRK